MNDHITSQDVDGDGLNIVEEPLLNEFMNSDISILKRNGENKRDAIKNNLQYM